MPEYVIKIKTETVIPTDDFAYLEGEVSELVLDLVQPDVDGLRMAEVSLGYA